MTSKIYKSAQGVTVDLGVLMLQNEHVRAVGNMKVNARGDKIDSQNQVIETKPQQIQRQNDRVTTNVSDQAVHTSAAKARRAAGTTTGQSSELTPDPIIDEIVAEDPADVEASAVDTTTDPVADVATDSTADTVTTGDPVTAVPPVAKGAGLAGAIARTRTIKQELDRTRRQQAQDSGVKKI